MKLNRIVALALVAALCCPALTNANDIYVSFSDFGDGGALGNNATTLEMGQTGTAFIWVDENFSIDTGAFLDVLNSDTNVIQFMDATVFNPDIVVGPTPVDTRWQSVGDQGITAGLINELNGFSVNVGTGILPSQTTGNTFVDELYDPSSSAFLFASVTFTTIGQGTADISLAIGDGLIVNDNVALNPKFNSASVTVGVPEPASATLLAIGLVGLVSRRRR